jgi:hypothetical protein
LKENNLKKLLPLLIKSKKEVKIQHPNKKFKKIVTAVAIIKDRFPLSWE